MHEHMQEQMKQQQNYTQTETPQQSSAKPPAGDYIDFEEIK